MSRRHPLMISTLLLGLLIVLTPGHAARAQTQAPAQTSGSVTSLHLKWPGQQGVLRYRLQVARDDKFQDIVFDRAVFGTEYVVELSPGRYYWHVAPAVKETGTYTPPRLVEITEGPKSDAGVTAQPSPSPSQPAWASSGWRTTTGAVARPLLAHLRTTTGFDLVGVNADGMAYGLDGTNGVAVWTARFRPNAKRGEPTGNNGLPVFTPILIDGPNGLSNVVVAFDGGVRALEGSTGRELWRATLSGNPVSGGLATPEGGGARSLLIVSDKSTSLAVINPENGKAISEVKLDAPPVAAAAPFPLGSGSGVIFTLEGGMLDVRNSAGVRMHSLRMDTTITTPAHVINGPRGALVLVGTESGLISLSADDLKPLGRIATEGDAPWGSLASADLDGDGTPEVLVTTRRGRIAAVGTSDGKIKWYNSGAADAGGAAFADINSDGVLDVLVAAGDDFARAFNGRDGSLLWRAEEDMKNSAQPAQTNTRALVAGRFGDGSSVFVVGTDSGRTGLRAVGLPKDSVRASR